MPLKKLNEALVAEVAAISAEGRAKSPERIITGYLPPEGDWGPRYLLEGASQPFLRMNSNSYLSLSSHPRLIEAADRASRDFGAGPGAVRFIDGTYRHHRSLEARIATYVERPAARIFNSAYTANLGLCLTVAGKQTYWIGDELNHNCIIRGMRIANVPRENRAIFKHNDVGDLRRHLENVPPGMSRVVVIFDGVFSMRGDVAPLQEIAELVGEHDGRFAEGVITVVDDSHGIGAFGQRGRGTEDHTGAKADVVVGTFGKAFGVNGGFVAASPELVEAIRQKADTYIYTNPLGVADCAAAEAAVDIADSDEGMDRLRHLHERIRQFRDGLEALGLESIDGPHPVVPVLVRDTDRTRAWVKGLFERGVLVVGLTFPVVPKGDETIRFQINAAHTAKDIQFALEALGETVRG